MTPEELKLSILQSAFQGKLTSQKEIDGTGQELLEQIKEEKQRLIAIKEIKKEILQICSQKLKQKLKK